MNATYVDQSDTIRTLTEEELAVVSGGNWVTAGGNWQAASTALIAEARAWSQTPYYVPPTNMNYFWQALNYVGGGLRLDLRLQNPNLTNILTF
jgi:hypothetical protein